MAAMRAWFSSLLLAALVCVVFWPLGGHPFIRFDDPVYVVRSPQVLQGLHWAGVKWAFTSTSLHNWHPLTWLSHMADVQFFGLDAGKHHLVSLCLHTASTVLLFLLLRNLTGQRWPSWVVAALFGVHPLHVESVAWVAERKDVLSGFLCILAITCHVWYLRRGSWWRLALAVSVFALGLMAKPMLVTLPVVLLLVDWWPLARFGCAAGRRSGRALAVALAEKIPFFLLSAVSAAITWAVQREGGGRDLLEVASAGMRMGNAVRSYVLYVVKTLWPADLSVYYPFPHVGWPVWHVGLFGAALVALTALALASRRRRPYAFVGWFWFLVVLLPVIGIVRIGGVAMADRYSYLPMIGLHAVVAWGARQALAWSTVPRASVAASTAVIVLLLSAAAREQVGLWASDERLFTHAAEVTADNWQAHFILGDVLGDQGRASEALAHYREAARIYPAHGAIRSELGMALEKSGLRAEALEQLRAAVSLAPRSADAHNNLGAVLYSAGRMAEAIAEFEVALRIDPRHGPARRNLLLASRYRR